MLTVIGVLLILFSCTALALQKIRREKEKIEIARSFRQLFSYLAERIEAVQQPMPQLLAQAAKEELGEAKRFVRMLSEALSDGTGHTLDEAWRTCLHTFAEEMKLTPCMRRILKNAGSNLGRLAAHAEIERLDFICAELDEEAARCEKEFSGKAKLIRSSGILIGILIVILFI